MVEAYYQDAYAILEQSFHSRSGSHPLRQLPRKLVAPASISTNSSPLDSAIPDRVQLPHLLSSDNKPPDVSALHSPVRLDLGLPPTPPSNISSASPESQQNRSVDTDGIVVSLMSQKSGPSTPIHQRSPPTPETTPPHSRHLLSVSRPSLKSHTPSSFAGSFRTAREEFSADADDGRPHAPSEASTYSHSEAWSHSAGRLPDQPVPEIGLGLNFEYMAGEGTSAESTPGERYPGSIEDSGAIESAEIDASASSDSTGNWRSLERIGDPLRNAAVEMQAPNIAVTIPAKAESTAMDIHAPNLRKDAKEQGLQDRIGSLRPNIKKSVQEAARSSLWHDTGHVGALQDEQRRLSSMSTTSNIVEAMVISSPAPTRPQHRNLRRMGKNVSLRTRDCRFESCAISTTQISQKAPVHRLVHKNSPIPERRTRQEHESISSARVVSNPEPPRPDSITLSSFPRPPSAPGTFGQRPSSFESAVTQVKQPPPGLDRVGLGYFDIAKCKPPSPDKAPCKKKNRDPVAIARPIPLINEASARRDENLELTASPISPRHTLQRLPEHASFTPNVEQPLASSEFQRVSQQHELDEDLRLDELGLPIMGTRIKNGASPDNEMQSTNWNTSSNLGLQFNRSRRSLETTPKLRSSGDNLLAPKSDHSLARHMHARASPHSETSTDQPDTLEVSEATAVSIYPHNNNSLLVVQQLARPATAGAVERRHTISSMHPVTPASPARTQSQPIPSFTATISPSTPRVAILSELHARDTNSQALLSRHLSPIMTQHLEPHPPAFKIIPPTPLSEVDFPHSPVDPRAPAKVVQLTGPGVPTNASLTNHNTLTRRLSLRQRARRLSEPIIQPLLHAKAQFPLSGNKNRYNLHTQPPSVPSVSDVTHETNKLHPFWRPRGFWDDFSDSEADDEYIEDDRDENDREPGFLVAGRYAAAARPPPFFDPDLDRLPIGGDTSNVSSPPPFSAGGNQLFRLSRGAGSLSRRFGSLGTRSSGEGFLAGNSLGIRRQPTNLRRHVVTLPAVLRGRLTTGTVGREMLRDRGSVKRRTPRTSNLKQTKRQRRLLQGVRWSTGIGNRLSIRLGVENDREAERVGLWVPMKLERVKERLLTTRKEKRRRKLKSRIGKIELIEGERTAQI